MIDYCYHTHTWRCGHAFDSDEEYVQKAIENGFKVLGFSDHVILPNVIQKGMRGTFDLYNDYLTSINSLKEKYKSQIEIHLGFECEYMKRFVPFYKEILEKHEVEYLILGQHCNILPDDSCFWYFSQRDIEYGIDCYISDLCEGIASGLFKYVAHPDLFVCSINEFDERNEARTRRICEAAAENNVALEINLGKIRWLKWNGIEADFFYPYDKFWKIVSEYNIPVYIGIDAHGSQDFKITDIKFAEDIVKKYNLKLLTRIKM